MELSGNDGGGRGSTGEAMDGIGEGENPTRCIVHRERGGPGGRMVSGSNQQLSGCHGKGNQDLPQVKEVVECRHQRMKKDVQEREKENMALGGGCPGAGRASEVDQAV